MEDDELTNLLREEKGKHDHAAADLSLAALTILGAYKGEVNESYRVGTAKALVGVLTATSSVRICIEAVHDGPLTDEILVLVVARWVARLFELESAMLISQLMADAAA